MPDLMRLTNGVGPGQLVAQVNRLYQWAFGDPLQLPGGVAATGQLVVSMEAPLPITGAAYHDGHVQLVDTGPGAPRIGFHEANVAAVALYKPVGGVTLRMIDHVGNDYAVAGPPNTAQALLGSWNAGSAYSTSGGPWQQSSIAVDVTSNGSVARIEWSVCIANTTAGAVNYVAIGWDGAAQWNVGQVHTPGANYHMMVSGCGYANLPAGPHHVALWFGVGGGTLQVQGINNMLYVTEQRC